VQVADGVAAQRIEPGAQLIDKALLFHDGSI
jgi:hypothetical protein